MSGANGTSPYDGSDTRSSIAAASNPPDCKPCKDGENSSGFPVHGLWTWLSCSAGSDPSCRDCDAFNACHKNEQSGSCERNHWSCGSAGPEQFDAIVLAGELDDPEMFLAAVGDTYEHVEYNRERNAIQLLDCTENVVAHIAIGRNLQRLLE